ncbi:hypothetical protein OOA_03669 [Providencia burhodogranariea DSM 19968]|uniref:Uncharacterized protein n=1 Tax=Providencia burhodogranariea DSM 19968 TaxID=1141662 RepID=K8X2P6_9GAMM|nr:hypothetical protein OOA_03669 [Providencia burhodogranariea DSM 19968]
MKTQQIEILCFSIIILLLLANNSFNQSTKKNLSKNELNEIATCLYVKKCIFNQRLVCESQKGINPIKQIKNFIRKNLYSIP